LVLCWPSALAWAQPPPQPTSISQGIPEADFLFGRPRVTLGIRASYFMPAEGSDLFDFVQQQLTIDHGDFNQPAFSADVGIAMGSRLDAVIGVDLSGTSVPSEYRDFVDNNFLPIEQVSSLHQRGLTGSVRLLLTPRGRSVGRFAFVPAAVTPYAGAGGGLLWWEFKQSGDFVDFQDLSVFTETFLASGLAPSAHVFGGVDFQVYRRLMVSVEGRYQWASDELTQDFVRFEPIDLSGFRFSAGINVLF
jgi:hypothetical protein